MNGLRAFVLRAIGVPALLALAVLSALPQGAAAQEFPKLTGRVVDAANIIPDDVEARLNGKLEALEKQSNRQLVVATIPDLQGYEISDYGYQLGRSWGIGQKGEDNGALLIVAPKERKVRIEVGYGLEPVLTDGMSSLIISNHIVPMFKAGDMPGGIEAGTNAIINQLTLPPEEAQKIAAQANQDRAGGGGISLGTVIFILMIVFFVVVPMINEARGGGRKRRHGSGPIVCVPGSGSSNWSSGGWSGGGSGGGFSRGGGSFRAGGVRGKW